MCCSFCRVLKKANPFNCLNANNRETVVRQARPSRMLDGSLILLVWAATNIQTSISAQEIELFCGRSSRQFGDTRPIITFPE